MELILANLCNNRILKWSAVVFFYIAMLCLSEAVIQSCMFIPNDSQRQNNACLEYWTTSDMTNGCIFSPKDLEFTGRTKIFKNEYLITVNFTENTTMETFEIWVQRKDGTCLHNCCYDPVKFKRFLLDAKCNGNWFCNNGGYCHNNYCVCIHGYYGHYCGKHDPCHHVTCYNGRHCSEGNCMCPDGYYGHHCEHEYPCHGVTCQHGNCTNGSCTCESGYTGQHCEMNDHCIIDPCNSHGTCSNSPSGYTCTCYAGYSGNTCDQVINYCLSNQCNGHGKCYNSRSGYSCICNTGYEGTNCEKVTDHCLPDPCHGHGSCFNSITGYLCSCNAGYTGTSCNNSVHHCSPNPCNGHGTCHYTQIGFTCTCNKGYTGHTCASVIDHCSSNPCHGHGDCYNGVGGHFCQCHPGFSGTNCQTATTKQPIVGSGPISPFGPQPTPKAILPFGPQPTPKDHVCDKMGLLMDLATGKSVTMQNANACGGKSSDAVILKHCQAPPFSKWKKGIQVNSYCSQLKHYIPIAEWTGHGFSDTIGILVSCQNGVIEMMSQSCSRNIMVHNVTAPASDLMYTVDWM